MHYKPFADFREEVKSSDEYWVESAKLDFALELNDMMIENKISKSALAARISKSAPYVSKILKGDTNFTIETMVKLTRAIGGCLSIHISRKEAATRWYDVITAMPATGVESDWQRSKKKVADVEYLDGQEQLAA